MSELLKALDLDRNLKPKSYFTLSFNAIASKLSLEVPMKASKQNMDNVLCLMDFSSNNYSLIFKNWNIENSNNADFRMDFTDKLLYKSKGQNSLIEISFEDNTLYVDFYYDCSNLKLEEWVIAMNHKLRNEFGLARTPTFKVLTISHSFFHTEDVRMEKIQIDINNNYNENFSEVHKRIDKSINSNESGMILLYGKPGTGKTTYIKSLISKHRESNFIFIQNEFVSNLLDPSFISFLLKQKDSILVIEDAEKVIMSREQLNGTSVVSTILQLTDGLFSDYLNIKVICTFNTKLSKIDTALLRKGRMIAMYEFNTLSIEKTNKLLTSLGADNSDEKLTVSDIFNKNKKEHLNIKKTNIGF